MAREPERKLENATFRCLAEEGFIFPGKVEYVGHQVNLPGGGTHIEWRKGKYRANCPHDPLHRIAPVE